MDVVVDHHVAVLQILPFGDTVRGDQNVDVCVFQPGHSYIAFLRNRGEACQDVGHATAYLLNRASSRIRAGHFRGIQSQHAGVFADVLVQVVGGVCECGEDKNLVVAGVDGLVLLVADGPVQTLQLRIVRRVDTSNHVQQAVDNIHVAKNAIAPGAPIHVGQQESGLAFGSELVRIHTLRIILV